MHKTPSSIEALPSLQSYRGVSTCGYLSTEARQIARGVQTPYQKAQRAGPNYRCVISIRTQIIYLGTSKDPRVLAVLSDYARKELAPWLTAKAREEINYPTFEAYQDLPEEYRERVQSFKKTLTSDRWSELQEFNSQKASMEIAQEFEERTGEDSSEAFIFRLAEVQTQINQSLGTLLGIAQQAVGRYSVVTAELIEKCQKIKILETSEAELRREVADLKVTLGIQNFNKTKPRLLWTKVERPAPKPIVEVPATPDVGLPLPAEETPAALDTPPSIQ